MNVKRELIALAVRALADHTSLVRKPDSFEVLLNNMFGQPTYDELLARRIEKDIDKGIDAIKRCNTNRKFKKITQNI